MKALAFYTPLFLILFAWQALSSTGVLSPDLIPSPVLLADGLRRLLEDGTVFAHAGVSVYRQMTGLVAAAAIGTLLGIAMGHYPWVRTAFEPLVRIIYPLPKSALIPLLILWFGIGHLSKIGAVFLGCLLPIVVSAFNGTRGVDRQLIWSARSLGTGETTLVWRIYFMAALPEILSGLRIALAMSYTLLISSEFLIARDGLGFLIQAQGEVGDYAGMFAGVLIVALIGFTADRLYVALMNHLLRWRERSE